MFLPRLTAPVHTKEGIIDKDIVYWENFMNRLY